MCYLHHKYDGWLYIIYFVIIQWFMVAPGMIKGFLVAYKSHAKSHLNVKMLRT